MSSVFLPKTSFPMKGNLPEQEPKFLKWWQEIGLYEKQRALRKGCPLFILHDGPPYANGPIHIGHALNKVLKDFVNRFHFMRGQDISFIPGWDCHGLPIETKVEEKYAEKNQEKKAVPLLEFREECRRFAQYWIDQQIQEFKRLGICGNWDHPYQTMDYKFEATIISSLIRLVEKGYVYHGIKPVMWSPIEETALAEAEVEYKEIDSPSVYVRFPVLKKTIPEMQHASIVIWTTTPWSLPANRAICYQNCSEYVIFDVEKVSDEAAQECLVREGERLIVAKDCLEAFCEAVGIVSFQTVKLFPATLLQGAVCAHPLQKEGYDFEVPLLPGEHVTTDTGTGFVHTAPCHGVEDFLVARHYSLEIPETVDEKGYFLPSVPLFNGLMIWKAFPQIREALVRYGALVAEKTYHHSYPHSWRSKTPLIYRTTPQWFIMMDGPLALRTKALKAIQDVRWLPASGETRLSSMVAGRPDWCISRQRTWGVPLTLFVHAHTGELLVDPDVFASIIAKVAEKGCDFWFTQEAYEVLGPKYRAHDWIKIADILDVWFEAGVTHEAVLKKAVPALPWPADLYLEGSDQHRGWFQASLLTGVGLEGQAPFKTVVTHGFLLDEQDRKMSKSLGNTFAPSTLVQSSGADILRLWVAHEDYSKDIRLGSTILKRVEDIYRRFRNTLRYLLGGMKDLSVEELTLEWPSLEKWVHHRMATLSEELQTDLARYDFQAILRKLHLFANTDLSSFYFDICKDSLYCDPVDSPRRHAIRTTFLHLFIFLTHWLAPLLCFTAEEAWHTFARDILGFDPISQSPCGPLWQWLEERGFANKDSDGVFSIHMRDLPRFPESWLCPVIAEEIEQLREVRSVVTSALEIAREKKEISSSLQAAPVVYVSEKYASLCSKRCADICLTSSLEVKALSEAPENSFTLQEYPDIRVCMQLAKGEKCKRCWKILQEVPLEEPSLCQRCQAI